MQAPFKIAIFSVDVDLHIFTDPDIANFGHSEVFHCVADGVPLRIEHRFLRLNNDVYSHGHMLTRI